MTEKIYVPMEDRPKCITKGCKGTGQAMGIYNKAGYPLFRKLCAKCHSKKTAAKHGLNNIAEVMAFSRGYESVSEYQRDVTLNAAKNAGFDSVADYLNSKHEYRQYRVDYCENRDGRLGYKCRFTIRLSAQLHTDHIDGNPTNNVKSNLQTLCANCHIYKTHTYGDNKTPGRKTLKSGLFTGLV